MKNWLKRISLGLFCVCGLFYITSFHVFAEEEKPRNNSGEMRFKIERIGENDDKSGSEHRNIKTELEKKFPDLFQEETRETINLKKDTIENSTKELEQSLFEMPSGPDTALNDMKQTLFSSDYVAPVMVTSPNSGADNSNTGPMSNKIFAGLTGLIGMLSIGAYAMLQNLSE